VVAHGTPTTPDARPNLLKLSESLTEPNVQSPAVPRPPDVQNSRPVTIAFKCMSKKNACAHQAHHCCNRLDHRTNPYAPLQPQNDCSLAQSKRFTGGIVDRRGVMICCNRFSESGANDPISCPISIAYARKSMDTRSNDSFTTQRQIIHHTGPLPISAVFRLRYLQHVMRRWAASWGSGGKPST
jgi:hypothetical protein